MSNFDSSWIKTVFFYASYFLAQTRQKTKFAVQMNDPLAYEKDGATWGFPEQLEKKCP